MIKGSNTYAILKEIEFFKNECLTLLDKYKEKVEFPV